MSRKIRILHVLGRMNRGGVETWLMHVLRAIDRSRYQLDFFVHTTEPSVFDAEIASLGSRIFQGGPPASVPSYVRRLRGVLSDQGPYDAVHSHVHHSSGLILLLAAVLVGLFGWIIAVVGGGGLLALLLGEPYRLFAPELAWLMATGILAYLASALGYALTAARQIHVQVPMLLVACLAVAGASFALVPRHGILGAAWAVGAGFCVQVLGSLAVLWKSAPQAHQHG